VEDHSPIFTFGWTTYPVHNTKPKGTQWETGHTSTAREVLQMVFRWGEEDHHHRKQKKISRQKYFTAFVVVLVLTMLFLPILMVTAIVVKHIIMVT